MCRQSRGVDVGKQYTERREGEGSDSPGTEILRCAQDDRGTFLLVRTYHVRLNLA